MLPAGLCDVARPTRFLRHEKIAAPVLMLPRHLAQRPLGSKGRMGYEHVDKAIIRSWNEQKADEPLHDDAPINGGYVDGIDRTQPASTMRVFIAPEAAMDLVVCHGKLDHGDSNRTRRGGLRDVAYTPAHSGSSDASEDPDDRPVRPSGFPVAITSRRDALDPEGAIYQRVVAAAADSQARGVPVFEPGVNSTGPQDIGYLPDPAIDLYCIRARIRGSDCYLDSRIAVALYPHGASYPDAWPLVVEVRKAAGCAQDVRPVPPGHISDIASEPVAGWIDGSGNFSRRPTAEGARGPDRSYHALSRRRFRPRSFVPSNEGAARKPLLPSRDDRDPARLCRRQSRRPAETENALRRQGRATLCTERSSESDWPRGGSGSG